MRVVFGWVFGAVAFFLFGVFLSPDGLIALGIMDASLQSEIEVVRKTAHLEVELARWVAIALGGTMAVLALTRDRIRASARFQRFASTPRNYNAAYEAFLPRLITIESLALVALLFSALLYLIFAETLFSEAAREAIHREDGVIETLSAVLLISASAMCAKLAFSKTAPGNVRAMHMLLAILFFVMMGEETSWGQRYFGIETPDALRAINVQGETNFHNIYGYFFDHLFMLAFFLWGCVVPVLNRVSGMARTLFRAIGLPIPSLGIAFCMLAITLTQEQVLAMFGLGVEGLRVPELREFLSAAAFVALASQSLRGFGRPKLDHRAPARVFMPGE